LSAAREVASIVLTNDPARLVEADCVGVVRIGKRTKDLTKLLRPGQIAVVDHCDLDRLAAEGLIEAQVTAVINAAPSISGRYPTLGPLLLVAAGVVLLDDVGIATIERIDDGARVSIVGDEVLINGVCVGRGKRQTLSSVEASIAESKLVIGNELTRFAENTLEYMRAEQFLLLDSPSVPELVVNMRGRHVLVVVRGDQFREDLRALDGYIREVRPLIVAVDGGADAVIKAGHRPDIILGDFDSVSDAALRCGAQLIVHAYGSGNAPGGQRLTDANLGFSTFALAGTSEDVAMLLAFEKGAELIVAVGTHVSLVDFLDKGRPGMASTFLTRLKVGPILVDAKGVHRLYRPTIRTRDDAWLTQISPQLFPDVAMPRYVAIVPVYHNAETVALTLRALCSLDEISEIVVIDDGSTDASVCEIERCRAERNVSAPIIRLIRLHVNIGKGGAVREGLASMASRSEGPNDFKVTVDRSADAYVFIDADLGESATIARDLLAPIRNDTADMVVAVPLATSTRSGGFGLVRRFAAMGIKRASGFDAVAPLSGQRAIRADALHGVELGDRFGLETALTIDIAKSGARIIEQPVAFIHRSTGRSIGGFAHRARQGCHVARALWSRVTTARLRIGLMVTLCLLLMISALIGQVWSSPSTILGSTKARRVVLFGFPRLSLNDLETGAVPTVDQLVQRGAIGATSVRTLNVRPATVEAYASIGAGTRVRAKDVAADAYLAGEMIGTVTSAQLGSIRTGEVIRGDVVVTGMAETINLNTNRFLSSEPGALGEALHLAKKRTGVVNTSDTGLRSRDSEAALQRPAPVALADRSGAIDFGEVGEQLLRSDPSAPTGATVNQKRFIAATIRTLSNADVIVVDPGEMDRAFSIKPTVSEAQFEALRLRALRMTDSVLAAVVAELKPNDLLIVAGVRPPTATWELTPTVIYGAGVAHGLAYSPSTHRVGLITLTDIAPTILRALGVPVSSGMIGHALDVQPAKGSTNTRSLTELSALANYRERIYLPSAKGYIVLQALVYLAVVLLFATKRRGDRVLVRGRVAFESTMLLIAAWPLATFVFRAIPFVWRMGALGVLIVPLIDIGVVALARRFRRHRLSAFSAILLATISLIAADVLSGARLQQASILGYSPHTAARFTGIGNSAFAVLAASALLWAGIHVHFAPRRFEALVAVSLLFVLVLFVDAAPMFGSDVGGVLTLVPVFGGLLLALSGRKVSARWIAAIAAATLGGLSAMIGIDLLRPADQRTHVARFVADIFHGVNGAFANTIQRKLSTNIRVLTSSFWTWAVPIVALVLLFFLVVQRGWSLDLPSGSALRMAMISALSCGLLGFAVNDSGSVVTALVFVYLGPFVVLLALTRSAGNTRNPRVTMASDQPGSGVTYT
jgi:uncharacterized membrane-anchored protein